MGLKSVRATWMRGGTSKGLFFLESDLAGIPARDAFFLSAIGSPDPYGKQMDGMGGATSSTSKIAVISPSQQTHCDVDYLFGHVDIETPVIDYSGNCGNLTAAVGVFAIQKGLVKPKFPTTTVAVWQRNLAQRITVKVPTTREGKVEFAGEFTIPGVAGSGAAIAIEFDAPSGKKNTLPTGNSVDELQLDSTTTIKASLIFAGNATIIVRADALAQPPTLQGHELPHEVNQMNNILEQIETIRCMGAVAMGLADSPESAAKQPSIPKVAIVSAPISYVSTAKQPVDKSKMDICCRIFSMGKMHHAFTGTGAIALAVAANIPGSLVNQITSTIQKVRLGNPAGVMEAVADVSINNLIPTPLSAGFVRTARPLMEGLVMG